MTEKTPEQEGYKSIITVTQADLRCFVDLLNWLREEWLPQHDYETEGSIVRNSQGGYEIMAKPKP